MVKGKLYLVPTTIADVTSHKVIPDQVINELKGIQHFLAENIRTARRYLSNLNVYDSIDTLHFDTLNKDTPDSELKDLFEPIYNGLPIGVMSESGCPGIADPGTIAVAYAHRHHIHVVPLVGPSSIVLALMASGLNGQCFVFNGYLPIKANEAEKAIRDFEKESVTKKRTQIFIETPYRNNALYKRLIGVLRPETTLCVAVDLTGSAEMIRSMPVKQWRKESIELPKLPTIFLFSA